METQIPFIFTDDVTHLTLSTPLQRKRFKYLVISIIFYNLFPRDPTVMFPSMPQTLSGNYSPTHSLNFALTWL